MTATPKPRALKPYEITDANGQHVGYAIAKSGPAACALVAVPLSARALTAAEAASVAPGDFVREGSD
jgi:hypothetical protein